MIGGAIAISRCRDIARWTQWVCFLWENCADFARFDPIWVSMGCTPEGTRGVQRGECAEIFDGTRIASSQS